MKIKEEQEKKEQGQEWGVQLKKLKEEVRVWGVGVFGWEEQEHFVYTNSESVTYKFICIVFFKQLRIT